MDDSTSTPSRPRRVRWPAAVALAAVGVAALALTFAVAGGLSGPAAPGAESPAAPVADDGAPAVGQGGIVDAGWVAPAGKEGRDGRAAPGNRGWGNGKHGKFGAITITAVDGAKLALVTEDGWTRTIDATAATVTRDGQAIAVGDLRVGDEIAFRQQRQDDGTFKITKIQVILPTVSGTVTEVTGSSLTLAARDGTKTTVKLTGSTAYRLGKSEADKSAVRVGMAAVATGSRAADGTLTATSVKVKASRLAGTVSAVSGSTITVAARDGAKTTVKVSSTTTYRVAGVEDAKLADVKADMWIVVQGLRNDDGSFGATAVAAAAAGHNGKGWGDWKPFKGNGKGGADKSPAPAATQQPASNG